MLYPRNSTEEGGNHVVSPPGTFLLYPLANTVGQHFAKVLNKNMRTIKPIERMLEQNPWGDSSESTPLYEPIFVPVDR